MASGCAFRGQFSTGSEDVKEDELAGAGTEMYYQAHLNCSDLVTEVSIEKPIGKSNAIDSLLSRVRRSDIAICRGSS